MKKLLYCLLLPCFFLLGNASFAHSSNQVMDGGIESLITNCKTGEVILSFQIPDIYVSKEGTLLLPLEISLSPDQKTSVFSLKSKDVSIDLPFYLSGVYYLKIQIGNFEVTRKISL